VDTAQATTSISARLPRTKRPLGPRMTGLLSLTAFLILWQLIVMVTGIHATLLPSPGSVAVAFGEVWREGILLPAVVDSLQPLFLGLLAALVVGVVLGLLIGSSGWLDLVAAPYLWGFFATPRIATAPVIILWLGLGFETKVTLVFISALLPVILSCKEGVQTVDETLVRAARSFGAGRFDLFRHVVIPYTLPFIANGVRNGIARGFVGLLIIEMTVGRGGIGQQVIRTMGNFDTARMFAFTAVLVVTALFLITLSRRLEAYASRWREEVYL
jgi:ABC-type nitrate/sulfonate/bicarbonate transport system permease component